MFQTLKDLSGTLGALVIELQAVRTTLSANLATIAGDEPLRERVEALELSRATWEAEVDGVAMKAMSTLKAARSAEERTRSMLGKVDEADDGDSDGEAEILRALEAYRLSQGDVDHGEGEGVPSVRGNVEVDPKEAALMLKFG